MRVNDAIVEKFVDSNIQMGKLLAVHDEKLDKQDRIDAVLFEKVEHLHKDLHAPVSYTHLTLPTTPYV